LPALPPLPLVPLPLMPPIDVSSSDFELLEHAAPTNPANNKLAPIARALITIKPVSVATLAPILHARYRDGELTNVVCACVHSRPTLLRVQLDA